MMINRIPTGYNLGYSRLNLLADNISRASLSGAVDGRTGLRVLNYERPILFNMRRWYDPTL